MNCGISGQETNMDSTSESNVPRFSKWHLAIAIGIGTPVALGIAYYYIKRNKNSKKPKPPSLDIYETNPKSLVAELTKKANRSNGKFETPHDVAKKYKNDGNKLFKEGAFDKAVECYTQAIDICPADCKEDLATFYQNRAASYANLKKYTEVINDTTKALEYNNTYVKALFRRAKAYEEIGELQKCLEDLTSLCILDGFQSDTYLKMTDKIIKTLSKTKAKEAFSKREPRLPSKHFARHYFISFSEDPIMKLVEEHKKYINERNPADMSGFRLVIHHMATENFNQVIPHCTVEIERNGPDVPEAYLVRGTFKLLQGQIEDARLDLDKLLSLESVDVKVRVNCLIKIATLKVQTEEIEESLLYFNKAIELDVNNADIYLHRGQVYLLMERIDECVKDMEKSCYLNPNFPSARAQKCYIQYRCGLTFNDEKQKGDAIKGFEDIEKNFPNCSESFFLFAQVLTECGDYEKSEKYFKKAGDLDPNDPNVFVHRGILTIQWKQDMDSGLEFLNKAIEMDDKCQFGYETLGTVEVQRGNLRRGLELLNKAVECANSETELAHLFSLVLAAEAQAKSVESFGLNVG